MAQNLIIFVSFDGILIDKKIGKYETETLVNEGLLSPEQQASLDPSSHQTVFPIAKLMGRNSLGSQCCIAAMTKKVKYAVSTGVGQSVFKIIFWQNKWWHVHQVCNRESIFVSFSEEKQFASNICFAAEIAIYSNICRICWSAEEH